MAYILIIDTAHPTAQVAVAKDGTTVAQRQWESSPAVGGQLLAAIDELLQGQHVSWEEIGRIAVHAGPGGYSSLRTGIVTASLLAMSHGKEQVAVSGHTLESMVKQAQTATPVRRISAVYKETSI